MHTTGEWKAEVAGTEVFVTAGGRFIAFFEADEDNPQEPEEVLGNAQRAAACVNACEGLENPAHAMRTLRADSGYLARYREAYCANVARQTDMELALRALAAEVVALRAIVTLGPDNDLRMYSDMPPSKDARAREAALVKARKAVDDLGATNVQKFADPARPDLGRYKGLDVRNVQLLLGAVEQLIASRRDGASKNATAVVGLVEFARLAGVLTECQEAPKVEDVR